MVVVVSEYSTCIPLRGGFGIVMIWVMHSRVAIMVGGSHGLWLVLLGHKQLQCHHSWNPQTATLSSLWLGVHVALSSWLGLHAVYDSRGGPWSGSHVVESSSLGHML